jgi:isocitrate dehydrogenase
MSCAALRQFFADEIADAAEKKIMLSLHLKATMMKISDPIIFGHAVSVFLAPVFKKHGALFKKNNINPNNGLADMLEKISKLPEGAAIKAEIDAVFAAQPNGWAMVDSAKGTKVFCFVFSFLFIFFFQGITNLHVPNDVIIDASMPPLIRDGGKMWNKSDKLEDTKALIPDRSYAVIYQAIVEDCRKHGQFDHSTMGSVANVGLMAQKAEEYGSHDKTFEIASPGTVRVVDASGKVLFSHEVAAGDIWRMCQTKVCFLFVFFWFLFFFSSFRCRMRLFATGLVLQLAALVLLVLRLCFGCSPTALMMLSLFPRLTSI